MDTEKLSGQQQLGRQVASFGAALSLALTPMASWAATPSIIPYSNLLAEVKAGEIERITFASDERSVLVTTADGSNQVATVLPSVQSKLVDLLVKSDIPFSVQGPPVESGASTILNTLINLAFPITLLLLFLAPRLGGGGGAGGMGGPGGGIMDMGKSKSKIQMEPETGVTFTDVAGCDGSKLELTEVVDFLKKPEKYAAVGAKAPRGVIMEGPPGTGKTLLARAVAGEAGVPFISASGSEFVEMFVGVGASRIRDLFGQAKKNAPCIMFIDEIDAIGKSRAGNGGFSGGGNDEREQTLNQILTEMDGFEGSSGVVVIAATNRADVLDAALLRPGRFDRRVPVDLPDKDGREQILGVHARSKPLDETVSLAKLAARTTGFSGASLSNLLNEAAIVAARRDKTSISISEVEYALDRLTVGMEKRTGMSSETRKELVAYHEAGHAIMGVLTPDYDAVGKVTIVPRTNGAGGFTLFVPSEDTQDSGMYTRRYLEAQLAVALGGRIAELLAYGNEDITTGASGDLQRVAEVARRMVTQWGFATNELGPTAWESPNSGGFGQPKMASEFTEKRIDDEVEKLVNAAYKVCKDTLTENRLLLDKLKDELMEKETIDTDELNTLVEKYAVKAPQLVAA